MPKLMNILKNQAAPHHPITQATTKVARVTANVIPMPHSVTLTLKNVSNAFLIKSVLSQTQFVIQIINVLVVHQQTNVHLVTIVPAMVDAYQDVPPIQVAQAAPHTARLQPTIVLLVSSMLNVHHQLLSAQLTLATIVLPITNV